jgi:uncharacterized membrane protein
VQADTNIRIAKGRFEAFSDGVFAIAITLLVLELPIPKLAVVNESTIVHGLLGLWPQLLVYCASFATIGIMWFNHYALFHYARHISYAALVANLLLLLLIAFLPYPTWLLGQYALVPAAVAFYGLTLLAISIMFGMLGYVATIPEGGQASIFGYLRSRNAWNTLGPAVYVIGTALAFVSAIGAIVLFAAIAIFYLLPGTVRGQLAAGARAHGQEA